MVGTAGVVGSSYLLDLIWCIAAVRSLTLTLHQEDASLTVEVIAKGSTAWLRN